MSTDDDPRLAALLAHAGDRLPVALVEWLLQSFAALEATDFGELEPVGTAAPVPQR